MDALTDAIKFIDVLYKANKTRPEEEQILAKEFTNDAINNSVDLKI
jgi:hypothetical protein